MSTTVVNDTGENALNEHSGRNGVAASSLAQALSAGMDPTYALKRLNTVGVESLWQVPLYLPTRFLDARHPITEFFGLGPTANEIVLLGQYVGDFRARWRPRRRGRGGPNAQGSIKDRNGIPVRFSVFGDSRSLQKSLEETKGEIALAGTLSPVRNSICINNPILLDSSMLGHIVPHYPGKPRVLATATARYAITCLLPTAIPAAAAHLRRLLREIVDESRLRKLVKRPYGTLEDLLWQAHFPATPEEGELAQQSLERLAALVTVGGLRKLQQQRLPVKRVLEIKEWRHLIRRVPFKLTTEQIDATERLISKFSGANVSATLINADVGMGKSIVYQIACAAAVQAGGRVAVLLPNERLATQAQADISRIFPESGAVLVTAKVDGNVAESPWLVGTTALLFRDIGHLDVCVVDEQHRFSVDQRRALARDGTHVVEISATPIPRTQALLLYGKLDVIRLTVRHSPQNIQTRLVDRVGTKQMVEEIRAVIANGGRVLIVCPRREEAVEQDSIPLPSVARVAEKWKQLFPGLVRALHGESETEDAVAAFADLTSGKARILVATTVVEVGLNITHLRSLVIVHAERFGISQLHQLRGRLAREGGTGQCYLYLPRRAGADAMARLQAVAGTNDGFELAEHDMRIRGIGDVSTVGERQHGSVGNLLLTRGVPMNVFIDMLEALGGI